MSLLGYNTGLRLDFLRFCTEGFLDTVSHMCLQIGSPLSSSHGLSCVSKTLASRTSRSLFLIPFSVSVLPASRAIPQPSVILHILRKIVISVQYLIEGFMLNVSSNLISSPVLIATVIVICFVYSVSRIDWGKETGQEEFHNDVLLEEIFSRSMTRSSNVVTAPASTSFACFNTLSAKFL